VGSPLRLGLFRMGLGHIWLKGVFGETRVFFNGIGGYTPIVERTKEPCVPRNQFFCLFTSLEEDTTNNIRGETSTQGESIKVITLETQRCHTWRAVGETVRLSQQQKQRGKRKNHTSKNRVVRKTTGPPDKRASQGEQHWHNLPPSQ